MRPRIDLTDVLRENNIGVWESTITSVEPEKWEHKMIRVKNHDGFQRQLEKASENGWRMVNFTECAYGADIMYTAVFIRPDRGQA